MYCSRCDKDITCVKLYKEFYFCKECEDFLNIEIYELCKKHCLENYNYEGIENYNNTIRTVLFKTEEEAKIWKNSHNSIREYKNV